MSEAVYVLIEHAFESLALRRLEADVDPRNQGSVKLLERIGFTREGLLRGRWIIAGEIQETALYGMLRGELRTP